MISTDPCLSCTGTSRAANTLYIGKDQLRWVSAKDLAIEEIKEQPFFHTVYKPKEKEMLRINARLRRLG